MLTASIICLGTVLLHAQKTVTGVVSDEMGPLGGVSVVVKGVSQGVMTGIDGTYSISVTNDNATLQFILLGYATKEEAIAGRTRIDVALQVEAEKIDELVVTALGMKREERALGYVTQKIGGERFEKVKGVNIATSLTGQIAGLNIRNSTEFMEDPTIQLRGEGTLLVIDGVPYGNMNLRDLNQDNIESINVLKGASASALYGQRGANGAIMVTTKKAGKRGFSLEINSSNMFYAGELALPKNQTSYSSGQNGVYDHVDYVWGAPLDVGRIAEQWDPIAKEFRWMELTSKGKNNFKDFLEFSIISNNTVSISQRGENGGIRSSISYLYNKAQYPNQKLRTFDYRISGDMKLGNHVTVDASLGFNKRMSPNTAGAGSWHQGYVYNILMWTGAEYRLKDYKDYWIIPHEKQNWHYNNYYDNPYLTAYECLSGIDENKMNSMLSLNYKPLSWLNVMVRSGFDFYSVRNIKRNPIGINAHRNWVSKVGGYSEYDGQGWSWNNDLIASVDKKFGKFSLNALAGGTIFYYQGASLSGATKDGLAIPGYYSLNNSKSPATVTPGYSSKQVNSLYGSVSLGYANAVFLDLTGRNDWSSTLPKDEQSYFYPSVGGSVIVSELISMPKPIRFWKLRASWTVSKSDLSVYAINPVYSTTLNAWDGLTTADYPASLRGKVSPVTNRTYELGTAFYLFDNNRLKVDFAYFNKLQYDLTTTVSISPTSGYTGMLVNTDEQFVRRGVEVTVDATPVLTNDFRWNVIANWSTARRYYAQTDATFTAEKPWIHKGARTDYVEAVDYQRDLSGNIVHNGSGLPIVNSSSRILAGYSEPDWIWGLINSFNYKNWTLTLNIDGRVGGASLNELDRYSWANGSNPDSDNQWRHDEVFNGAKNYVGQGVKVTSGNVTYDPYGRITEDTRAFAPNDTPVSYQTYIRTWAGTNNLYSFYQQSTFLKIREIALSYQLPHTLVGKIGMKKASVSLVGQNLLLWTKYRFSDPDKGLGDNDLPAPSVRYFGVNLNIGF
jgi:TonB-linked SusC/RagA family outer membrane protein